ncbi:carbon dioxide concentrating mechanism protein [Leptolyngbya sp. Heron Island J]|uniref:carbon dioxide concentrating mechanism protein n=1 Tax=Leptolyngbya sp. Heron Island J TaxID=1385935 RepID=UPI0003B9C4C7|nr:carbon dioxide concentrating mechanism protein [Leptolyngbya sp. Heron Island J]ESA36822.1 carbon dioxide concentrating mechanism protein [Leptolyngbya sp. Heron Island J]
MEPSPLHFVSQTHYYRGGDVVIDASAAIAPGVVLRAASDGSSVHIGPGVCVGAGVVIQARQGRISIEAGASLGTGALIVGHGYVGKDVCVGPSSTLINPAIAPSTVIPPCSLIEATTAQTGAPASQNGASNGFQTPNFQSDTNPVNPVPSMPMPPRTSPTVQPEAVSPKAVNVPDIDEPTVPPSSTTNGNNASSTVANQYVYGRDHLNTLLSALFPYRQPLNTEDTSSQAEQDS